MITIFKFLLVVMYVLCSLSLIFVVLLQQGKGAGMGASLGGGASQTLFGSRAPTFMSRFTGVLAAVFFLGAIALAKWPPFTPADAVDADGILEIEQVAPTAPATTDVEATEPAQETPAVEEAASEETQVPVEATTPEAAAAETPAPVAAETEAAPAAAQSTKPAAVEPDTATDEAAAAATEAAPAADAPAAATPDQGQ